MSKTVFRDKRGPLVAIIFFLVLLFIAEGSAYFFVGKPDRLERIRAILRQDRDLFWRQRPNLKTEFEGAEVRTNRLGLRHNRKKADRKTPILRIVTLGASPTFGWGVEQDETYARVLERLLQEALNTEYVEVINAGQIGYSSYQGLKFFEKVILPLKPNLITVSYVINDVDKYRFYRNHSAPDADLKPKNGLLVAFENALEHSRFFRVYRKLINGTKSASLQYFGQRGRGEYRQARRVSVAEYRQNIQALVKLAKQHGIDVVLVKMPVNLPEPISISEENSERADMTLVDARAWAEKGYDKEAITLFRQVLAMNPNSAQAHYYLGQLHQRQKNRDLANEHFARTVVLELYECATLAKEYHHVLEEISRQQNIRLVDLVKAFDEHQQREEGYLFLDPDHDTIHPNRVGHAVIGRAIYDELFQSPGWSMLTQR